MNQLPSALRLSSLPAVQPGSLMKYKSDMELQRSVLDAESMVLKQVIFISAGDALSLIGGCS